MRPDGTREARRKARRSAWRLLGCGFLLARASAADVESAARAETRLLFESHAPLALSLEAPFSKVVRERGEKRRYRPATLRHEGPQGSQVSIELRVRTRGKLRSDREVCRFPPLMLNFDKETTGGTLFAGQNKLKLVTHCHPSRRYEQYVLQEYLAYRVLNQLTDLSLRVRLAKVSYVDVRRGKPKPRYAFFLEPVGEMAARTGHELLEIPSVSPQQLDPGPLNLVEVFQYMIGNTDWSVLRAREGDPCCHNGVLLRDRSGRILPVPYDFDFAGVVNARYAEPNPKLRIRTVRERLYRGLCRTNAELERTLARFEAERRAIFSLYEAESGLDESQRRRALSYYDDFYEIIRDPSQVRREITDRCRQGRPADQASARAPPAD